MRTGWQAALLVGLGLTVFGGPASSLDERRPPALMELTPVPATASEAELSRGGDIRLADLPEVPAAAVAIDAREPGPAGTPRDLAIALPPEAPFVLTAADRVRALLQVRLADPKAIWPQRLPKPDREAIASFYAARGFQPVWVSGDGWTRGGEAVVGRLKRAHEDGLQPADYPIPTTGSGSGSSSSDTSDLADAEIKLSGLAALYARDARGGRLNPTRLSALITPKLELPSTDQVLQSLVAAPDPGAALEGYNPQHAGYRALRAKLAEIRASGASPAAVARLQPPLELTTQTIAVLDDGPRASPPAPRNPRLEADLIANMERWRWLPAELGARYVAVNIPEYQLRLIEGSRVAHQTRVIAGKPETPSPIFSGLMEYAVVNPSWHVPPSILKNEFLPRMAEDPSYAARQGYEVVGRGNAISIRQPPGERNALGFVKFMFPNNHAVYLHDTPNRRLFAATRRAMSHGCIRVENPFALADFVLGAEWTEPRLKRLIGRGERTIWLPQKLPVHLTYFTLSVEEAGELRSYEDIYGHDRRVRQALGLGVEREGPPRRAALVARP